MGGNRLIFLYYIKELLKMVTHDIKNIGRITRKSSLFFLTIMMKIRKLWKKLWNQFIWRNSLKIGKAIYFLGLSGIILTILKNLMEKITFLNSRTHNRIRSPR